MKKLILAAAALMLAVSTSPNLISQSKAAQRRSAYCDMTKSHKNPVSWNARYSYLDAKERAAAARAEGNASGEEQEKFVLQHGQVAKGPAVLERTVWVS